MLISKFKPKTYCILTATLICVLFISGCPDDENQPGSRSIGIECSDLISNAEINRILGEQTTYSRNEHNNQVCEYTLPVEEKNEVFENFDDLIADALNADPVITTHILLHEIDSYETILDVHNQFCRNTITEFNGPGQRSFLYEGRDCITGIWETIQMGFLDTTGTYVVQISTMEYTDLDKILEIAETIDHHLLTLDRY